MSLHCYTFSRKYLIVSLFVLAYFFIFMFYYFLIQLSVDACTVTYRILLGRFPGFGRGVSSRTLSGLKSLIGKYVPYVHSAHL